MKISNTCFILFLFAASFSIQELSKHLIEATFYSALSGGAMG